MPYTHYTKRQLVPFITGNDFPPTRTGPVLIALFNDFGNRDVYDDMGMPEHPRAGRRMSRKEYVENRLVEMDDMQVSNLLSRVLNELEQPDIVGNINQLITADGFSITVNNGIYLIVGGIIDRRPNAVNEAHFQDIQNKILAVLDEAQVSIKLVIAWFTNETLRDKLLEKQAQGIDVTIAIYDDGINRRHGVDLSNLNVIRLRRGLRGGLMHDKFCMIDNQVVISGSYNWTTNAETRNDENIVVVRDPPRATEFSVEYRRLTK